MNDKDKIIYKCPKCKKERVISKHQLWNIKAGISTGKCKKCGIVPNSGRFKKHQIPWNRGKKMDKSFCDKIKNNKQRSINISISRKGKSLSLDHRLSLRVPHINSIGKKHHNWKGGITKLHERIRKLPEYMKWRSDIYRRDKWICKTCNKFGGVLNVHHILGFSKILKSENINNIEKTRNCKKLWDINNGITLCVDCHNLTKSHNIKSLI